MFPNYPGIKQDKRFWRKKLSLYQGAKFVYATAKRATLRRGFDKSGKNI